jgi:RNA polymerase sigma factor (sigma-70 family)
VEQALRGDRGAFANLVSLHQGAASAVAYSICGDFHASEDIAQEAFVSAWKNLGELREKDRFRPWVCTMARNGAIARVRRSARRGEGADADGAEAVDAGEGPSAEAMKAEEAALVWGTIDAMDENYREPLILFYREEQSVAAVASALELSEEAVRQRLSRGRVILREELARRVEGALFRSRPGPVFTAAVMGALPPVAVAGVGLSLAASSAKAAGGTGAASSSGGGASALGIGGILAQFASALVGVLSAYLLVRFLFAREIPRGLRMTVLKAVGGSLALVLLFAGLITWIILSGAKLGFGGIPPLPVAIAFVILFLTPILFLSMRASKEIQKYSVGTCGTRKVVRRRSRIRFLGLPLYDVAFGPDPEKGEKTGMARGWLAFGDTAVGLVAFGGVAMGLVACGGFAFGALSIGGLVAGFFSLGGFALGWIACGGVALGWNLALGGFTVAHGLAVGGVAVSVTEALGGVSSAPMANLQATADRVNGPGWPGNLIRFLPYTCVLSLLGLPGLWMGLRYFHGKGRAKTLLK